MSDSIRDTLQAALGAGYRIERGLGGGGMSRVFVARDLALDRDVVVKVLPPEAHRALVDDAKQRLARLEGAAR